MKNENIKENKKRKEEAKIERVIQQNNNRKCQKQLFIHYLYFILIYTFIIIFQRESKTRNP